MKKSIFAYLFFIFLFSISCTAEVVESSENVKKPLSQWNQLFDSIAKRLSELENNFETKAIKQKDFNQHNADMENSIANLNARIDKVEKTGLILEADNIAKRLSELENNFVTKTIKKKDFNQHNAGMENSIANLNARIDKVEKTGSILETDNIAKSFKDTIDVLNKRSAEIANRLENLEVKVAVIEKIYRVSQKPLETLMKVIDEQTAVINSIKERLEKQDKMLSDIRRGSPDRLHKENQKKKRNLQVSGIEEKTATLSETAGKTEPSVTEKNDTGESSKTEEDILVRDVSFYSSGTSTKISGELVNKSNRDFSNAAINIQLYDKNDNLLETLDIFTPNFKSGSTSKFDQFIFGTDFESIAKYVILFNDMELTSSSGEIELQRFDKKKTNEGEATLSQPSPAVEQTIEKTDTAPVEEEEFKAIGNDFYIRNVSFSEFGASTVMKGEIKNDSRDNLPIASFDLKVSGKESDMKFETTFSIVSLESNKIKPFEQTIKGILPSQISEYKIVYSKRGETEEQMPKAER